MWAGQSTTSTNLARWLITGWFNATGGTVYQEGSVSNERAVQITASNVTWTVTDPVYGSYTVTQGIQMNQPILHGDSGGAIVQPTGYGPLAIASIIAFNATSSFGQYFSAYLYSYGVQVNVTVNPSYCTYS